MSEPERRFIRPRCVGLSADSGKGVGENLSLCDRRLDALTLGGTPQQPARGLAGSVVEVASDAVGGRSLSSIPTLEDFLQAVAVLALGRWLLANRLVVAGAPANDGRPAHGEMYSVSGLTEDRTLDHRAVMVGQW